MKISGEALVVANRYAKALFQVVLEKKEDPEQIDRELRDVVALLEANPELDRALGVRPSYRRNASPSWSSYSARRN